jgi:hypothetical protein
VCGRHPRKFRGGRYEGSAALVFVAVGCRLPLKTWGPDADGLTGMYSRFGHHILTRVKVLAILASRQ